LTWYGRTGAPTPFVDADSGRPVVGAIITGATRTPTPEAFAASVARHHADADASRDRHGATPSALPSPVRDVPTVPLTSVARTALRNATRPTTPADRERHAHDRMMWAAQFDLRLAMREWVVPLA
jgi:hypothetical protein